MNFIDVKILPFASKAELTWSFFWRALLVQIAAMFIGALLGGVIGGVLGFAGFPIELIQIVGGIVGLAVGFFFAYLNIQWLLSSRLGAYRLKLVRAETMPPSRSRHSR